MKLARIRPHSRCGRGNGLRDGIAAARADRDDEDRDVVEVMMELRYQRTSLVLLRMWRSASSAIVQAKGRRGAAPSSPDLKVVITEPVERERPGGETSRPAKEPARLSRRVPAGTGWL